LYSIKTTIINHFYQRYPISGYSDICGTVNFDACLASTGVGVGLLQGPKIANFHYLLILIVEIITLVKHQNLNTVIRMSKN